MARQFGIIGRSLGHSFSPSYFSEKFRKSGIDAVYSAFELDTINEVVPLLDSNPKLEGINVTIPYKEEIIPYLDEVSEDALAIGAVNTVRIRNGKTEGFNTDVIGFGQTLKSLYVKNGQALILGTGGAAKAVCYTFDKYKIPYRMVSSSGNSELAYTDLNAELMHASNIIVNTTPLGMWPDVTSKPLIPYRYLGEHHILIDLVYEPGVTSFLHEGLKRGSRIKNGFEMLVEQAEAAWNIWNSTN